MKLILASASPRRKELLNQMGVYPEVINTYFEETKMLEPKEQVIYNARGKAKWLSDRLPKEKCLIIAADTIVCLDNVVLNKPQNKEEAKNMMEALSNKKHQVLTALCVLCKETEDVKEELVITDVYFRELTTKEVEAYVNTDEPYDKAGGYAIQERAGIFVDKIEGSYSNVVGLPINELSLILKSFDIEVSSLW